MKELDVAATQAANDDEKLSKLIQQYKPFILRCASNFFKKHITDSDDEWSVALVAFSQAVKDYDANSGSFLSFAQMVIRRRLIDYTRSNQKYNSEISVNPYVLDGQQDQDQEETSVTLALREKVSSTVDESLNDEIRAILEVFRHYGFSFFDLADCSPKAEKTKNSCAKAVAYICKTPIILSEIKSSKQLPLKVIEKNTEVPRKILERHRKYIIAAVEILSGEYPCLAEYMWPIRKELNK